MAIKTASAKAKGRGLQQLVRDALTAMLKPFGVVAEDVKSTSMGASGEDIQLSPFARSLLPISIECKARKGIAVYSWFEQAEDNCGKHTPVVFIKADRKKPLALISLEYYVELERTRIESERKN